MSNASQEVFIYRTLHESFCQQAGPFQDILQYRVFFPKRAPVAWETYVCGSEGGFVAKSDAFVPALRARGVAAERREQSSQGQRGNSGHRALGAPRRRHTGNPPAYPRGPLPSAASLLITVRKETEEQPVQERLKQLPVSLGMRAFSPVSPVTNGRLPVWKGHPRLSEEAGQDDVRRAVLISSAGGAESSGVPCGEP